MSYFDEHNINEGTNSNQEGSGRQHQTLAAALDSFFSGNSAELTNALQLINSEMAEQLMEQLKEPTRGVDEDFLASLPRVDHLKLTPEDDQCPICTAKFTDDPHPLVVRLPCSLKNGKKDHIFDLDCIGPWLKVNATCPLCRFEVLDTEKLRREKLEAELKELEDSEEEEEWDADYA
ncbi:hypothetical protein DICA1_F29756 [Diutina catenulata]